MINISNARSTTLVKMTDHRSLILNDRNYLKVITLCQFTFRSSFINFFQINLLINSGM